MSYHKNESCYSLLIILICLFFREVVIQASSIPLVLEAVMACVMKQKLNLQHLMLGKQCRKLQLLLVRPTL